MTNASGEAVENTSYAPFGEILEGGEESRFDYEAKEYSSVVGDYDFHFRKYSPTLRMFTQPDTLIQNVYDPQTLNRYAFERNNPYKNVDEDGHIAITLGIVAVALFSSAVLGFAIGAVTSYQYQKSVHGEVDMARVWKSGAIGAVAGIGLSVATLLTGGVATAIGTSATSIAAVLGTEIAIDIASSIGLEYLEDKKEPEEEEESEEVKIEKEVPQLDPSLNWRKIIIIESSPKRTESEKETASWTSTGVVLGDNAKVHTRKRSAEE